MSNSQPSPHGRANPGQPTSIFDHRGLPDGYPFKPEYEWTPLETLDKLRKEEPSFQLVDCRTTPEWDLVHIEGAVHIPLDELEGRLDELDTEKRPVFLCHHGVRSLKAALLARAKGFPEAMSVAGGMELWSLAADTRVARYQRDASGCRLISS
jgi:rhodanese-related sulfurtransferase